jgi:hypothetical protein
MNNRYPVFKPGDLVRDPAGRKGIIRKELPMLCSVNGDYRVYEWLCINAGSNWDESKTYATGNKFLDRMNEDQ